MNLEQVVPQPSDVPSGLILMPDVSGPVAADQLYPGAAHGVRAVFVGDPWVLTILVTHFADGAAAAESVASFERVLHSTPREILPIEFLPKLSENAAGGVTTGDPEDEVAGALAMMAWSQGPVRCDLSLSGLTDEVAPPNFWIHDPATHLERLALAMADRARSLGGRGEGSSD